MAIANSVTDVRRGKQKKTIRVSPTTRKQRSPAKKDEARKSETIAPLRLTAEEKEIIYRAARMSDQTVSEFILNNILRVSLQVTTNELFLAGDEDLKAFNKKARVAKSVAEKMKSASKNAERMSAKNG